MSEPVHRPEQFSPAISLTAALRCNNLSYLAGRLAMSRTLSSDFFVRDAIQDVRAELARISTLLDAYEAAPDPDAEPSKMEASSNV